MLKTKIEKIKKSRHEVTTPWRLTQRGAYPYVKNYF